MYKVFSINKKTGQIEKILATGLTEKQAERFCESWGWNYSDENGKSFYIDYDKE